ncbi:hypothetical protein AB0280_17520 [Pseudarthrobacter sp902506025]|uniref:hypothetical protein n=1 Tax=Pseudarthrobacter sp. 902506025 TaxID=3155291 RepID=UPI00344EAF53
MSTPQRPGQGNPETIGLRLASYDRWKEFCAYLGGGIGALVLFGDLAKDSFEAAPHWMRALFITLILAAGIFLGRAFFGYVFASAELTKRQLTDSLAVTDPVPGGRWLKYPQTSFICYWIALVLSFAAAFLLCAAAWQT